MNLRVRVLSIVILLAAVLAGLSLSAPAMIQAQTGERDALIALYNSTNGNDWTPNQWDTTNLNHCAWAGVTCTGGYVTRLDLGGNQLTGSIPPELGNLSNLYILYLDGNQLSGPIPPELSSLSNLGWLNLSNNQLTGTIPDWLGSLANLQLLHLGRNKLSGDVPSELGNLSNLRQLFLDTNQLTGSIPPTLGSLSNLGSLYLSDNQLTGEIPPELGNLPQLEVLSVHTNQLTGSIPLEFANLSSLRVLFLGQNPLTGSIPAWLGSLSNMENLQLWDNNLSGAIPPELGNLSKLNTLILSENKLNGPIPTELGNLISLRYLDLRNNQLSGTIPPELGNLSGLRYLRLDDNDPSLCVPSQQLLDWFNNIYSYRGPQVICEIPKIVAVAIDIKPGSDPNSVNCGNEKEVIPVAILTTDDFDAASVNHTAVTFEGASETHEDKKSGEARRHEEDVDGDGDIDLVFHFRLGDTNLTCESEGGTLTGETFDGIALEGTDAIRVVAPKSCAAELVCPFDWYEITLTGSEPMRVPFQVTSADQDVIFAAQDGPGVKWAFFDCAGTLLAGPEGPDDNITLSTDVSIEPGGYYLEFWNDNPNYDTVWTKVQCVNLDD